jgi:hypothetical protein
MTYWSIYDIVKYLWHIGVFMTYWSLHDILKYIWQLEVLMTFGSIYGILKYLWHIELFMTLKYLWHIEVFMKYWSIYDIWPWGITHKAAQRYPDWQIGEPSQWGMSSMNAFFCFDKIIFIVSISALWPWRVSELFSLTNISDHLEIIQRHLSNPYDCHDQLRHLDQMPLSQSEKIFIVDMSNMTVLELVMKQVMCYK